MKDFITKIKRLGILVEPGKVATNRYGGGYMPTIYLAPENGVFELAHELGHCFNYMTWPCRANDWKEAGILKASEPEVGMYYSMYQPVIQEEEICAWYTSRLIVKSLGYETEGMYDTACVCLKTYGVADTSWKHIKEVFLGVFTEKDYEKLSSLIVELVSSP